MNFTRATALLARVLLPVGILAASIYAYSILSIEPEETKSAKAAARKVRTRVTRLEVQSYQVRVKTNGIVLPHNEVTLSSEVAGQIISVHPAMESGSYFSKGDVLIEIDDRDYQSAVAVAKAQKKVATAAHRLAKSAVQRLQQLQDARVVTDVELEEAQANLTQAEGELERIEVQIEQAERDLERTRVRAPFDGRVQEKSVGLGERVSAGTVLGTVFAVDYAEVRLPLAKSDLRFLRLPEHRGDEPVDVELRDAIDEASDEAWQARIVRTEGRLDPDSLELFAIARIDDPIGLVSGQPPLRIGQPVIAFIAGEMLHDVVLIPRGAVRQLDQVYLVDEENLTLSSLTVDPIWSDSASVVVRQPLVEHGDLLATTQIVNAPVGSEVEIIPGVEPEAGESSSNVLTATKVSDP